MPHPLLNSFLAYITEKIGAILQKNDQGEEDEQHDKEWIPHEVMIENILTRLPARTLAVCCCVSKLWHNSILDDSRFPVIHYKQNKDKTVLVFNVRHTFEGFYFFSLLGREKADLRVGYLSEINSHNTLELLIGYCNGLACTTKPVSAVGSAYGLITVVNPVRSETLNLAYLPPTEEGYIYLCHGFGFDSLSQVYKAVIVFVSEADDEFLCMVVTLGTMSWRTIITSALDILPPPHSSLYTSLVRTRLRRPATFCGGDLFWSTENLVGSNNVIEMLLAFDLHTEKIHFVLPPTESTLVTATTEGRYSVVDHLLEYKGYPCVARSEGITRSRDDNCGRCGHLCNHRTDVCCCCHKVHMYILKDKDKQVWTREETFDVQIMKDQEGPFCRYFNTRVFTPPMRILPFSDQVLLYWFDGERLIFYNLQEKHLKVVECSRFYPTIFRQRHICEVYWPCVDLHAQVENIVSLKTFVPKGAKTIKTHCVDEMSPLVDNNLAAGWLSTGRITQTFYAFS